MLGLLAWGADSVLVARKVGPAQKSVVALRLEELRQEQDVDRKELAGAVGKRRQTVDSALRGKSNMLLPDAEAIAQKLGARLEVVQHRNPVDEFRRALDANTDIDETTRANIWTLFERGKMQSLRARPKARAVGTSK